MKSSSGVNLDPEGFPVRLKAIRCFRNLKQVEIAKALGISSTVYSSWETGNHLPRGNNYTRLAQILNVPIELLVEGPKNGESVEDYLQLAVSKKFLSVLDCNSLNVDSKLPEVLKNSSKLNFSLLDGFENFYKEQKMFLYKIEDDSMARSFSNSINKGMTAVIVCELSDTNKELQKVILDLILKLKNKKDIQVLLDQGFEGNVSVDQIRSISIKLN